MDNPHAKNTQIVRVSLLLLIVAAFLDETVRKSLPNAPVLITGIKVFFLLPLAWAAVVDSRFLGIILSSTVYLIFVVGYLVFTAGKYGNLLFSTVALSIYVMPLLAIAGGYAVCRQNLWRRIHTRSVIVLMLFALLIGFGQEFFRPALPYMFSRQIVVSEKHAQASGRFVESLFVSQTVWGIPVLTAIFVCFSILIRSVPVRVIVVTSGFMVLSLANLFFLRKRVALVLAAAGLLGIFVLTVRQSGGWRRIKFHRTRVMVFGGIAMFAAISFFTLNAGEKVTNSQTDLDFSANAFDVDTIVERLFFFEYEFEGFTTEEILFGIGPGPMGQARRFITSFAGLPAQFAHDTGMFLIVGELGLVGVLTGLIPYLYGLFLIVRYSLKGQVVVIYPALMMTVFVSSVWFFFKANSVFQNSFCVLMWFGSYGFLLAYVQTYLQPAERALQGGAR